MKLVEIPNSRLKQYYYNVQDCYKNMLGVGKCISIKLKYKE